MWFQNQFESRCGCNQTAPWFIWKWTERTSLPRSRTSYLLRTSFRGFVFTPAQKLHCTRDLFGLVWTKQGRCEYVPSARYAPAPSQKTTPMPARKTLDICLSWVNEYTSFTVRLQNSNYYFKISATSLFMSALIYPGSHQHRNRAWLAVSTSRVFAFYKWKFQKVLSRWNKEPWTIKTKEQWSTPIVHLWFGHSGWKYIHRQGFPWQVKKTGVADRSFIQRRLCDLMECYVTRGPNCLQRQSANCTYWFRDCCRAQVGNWTGFFLPPPLCVCWERPRPW